MRYIKSVSPPGTELTNSNGCGVFLNFDSSNLNSTSSNPSLAPYCPSLTAHSSKNSKLSLSLLLKTSNNFVRAFLVPLSCIIP